MSKKIYLAIPYSGLHEISFKIANEVAAQLMLEGNVVFSPITHSHSLSQQCKLPTTWEFWLEQDREFVIWADELYIVVISDYFIPNTQGIGYENGIKFIENSVGVQGEILIATEHGKPIKYVMYNSIENKWVICRKINETTYARTED